MSVDGSCKKNPDGTNSAGYVVVTLEETLKAEPLPHHYSAQAAETATEACKTGKDKDVTIYTDGIYAFSCIQQWKNRGMATSTGKPDFSSWTRYNYPGKWLFANVLLTRRGRVKFRL